MVIKINYTSSDIYVSTNVSPIYVVVNYSAVNNGSGVAWGAITGTLSNQTDLQTALDAKVPYTGATANVNLGEFALSAGQLNLDTSPTGTASVGTTRWNDTTGVSETTLKGGSVILKNGVDLVARVVNKVFPNATLTKAAYQAVRVSGAQGQRLAVAYAQANNDANSADTIGLVCETIATNQEGFIMTVGQLEGINTTGSLQGETWVDGDVLYLSPFTPGAITKVKPTGAGHIVVIGYVEYAHVNNGKIYVKVMNGWELDELHDVSIVSPANNEALIYESATSLWKNKTIATALGYTPISGTGATGQVAYWNGTNSQTGSATLTYSPTSALLVNNSVTAATAIARGTNLTPTLTASANSDVLVGLDVNPAFTNGAFTGVSNIGLRVLGNIAETYPAILIRNTSALSGATTVFRAQDNSTGVCEFGTGSTGGVFSNIAYFYTNKSILDFYANSGNRMRIYGSTGNVVLQNGGTFTDAGYRLDVNGTARVSGAAYLATSSGSVGIGTTSPSYKLDVQGTSGTVAIRALSNTAGDILFYATGTITGSTDAFRSAINATGNVNAILANNNTATGGSTLDISVPSTSTGDPYISFTTSGATNWSIGIDNSDGDKLKIGPVDNPSNSSTAIVAHTTGNISLNSSVDAGFKLDVNGTARVSGQLTNIGNVVIESTETNQGVIRELLFRYNMAADGGGGTQNAKVYFDASGGSTNGWNFINGRQSVPTAFRFRHTDGTNLFTVTQNLSFSSVQRQSSLNTFGRINMASWYQDSANRNSIFNINLPTNNANVSNRYINSTSFLNFNLNTSQLITNNSEGGMPEICGIRLVAPSQYESNTTATLTDSFVQLISQTPNAGTGVTIVNNAMLRILGTSVTGTVQNTFGISMVMPTGGSVSNYGIDIQGASSSLNILMRLRNASRNVLQVTTDEKIGFFNATPIVQPTTSVAAAAFVANTSLIMNDTATFDGYTIGQVVKALRNAGLLA